MAKEFDKMSSKLNIDLFATAGVSFVWLDTTKSKGTGIFDFTPSENYHGFNASLGAIIEQQLAEKTKLTFTPELSAQHYSDDRVGQQSTTFSFNLKNNLKVGRWDFSVDPRFRKMYLTSQALDFKNSSKKDIYDVSAGIKFQPTEKLELGIGGNLMWMEGQKMVPAGSLSISYYPWKSTDVDAEVEYKRKR
jgi:opacity protein-like surface antigen